MRRRSTLETAAALVVLLAAGACDPAPTAPPAAPPPVPPPPAPAAVVYPAAGKVKVSSRVPDPEKELKPKKLDAGVAATLNYAGPKTALEIWAESWKDGKKEGATQTTATSLRIPSDLEFVFGIAARKNTEGRPVLQVQFLESPPGGSQRNLGKYLDGPLFDAAKPWSVRVPDAPVEAADDAVVTIGALVLEGEKDLKSPLEDLGKIAKEAWLFRIRLAGP